MVESDEISIALWGSGLSGKRSFLAAALLLEDLNPSSGSGAMPQVRLQFASAQRTVIVNLTIPFWRSSHPSLGSSSLLEKNRSTPEFRSIESATGFLFVADSQKPLLFSNTQSLEYLAEILMAQRRQIKDIPLHFFLNKQDLPGVCSSQELALALRWPGASYFTGVAIRGIGVREAVERFILNGPSIGESEGR